MPNAFICYWSLDETRVRIKPEGKGTSLEVWCDVKHDPAAGRLWCEWKGKRFHLRFV